MTLQELKERAIHVAQSIYNDAVSKVEWFWGTDTAEMTESLSQRLTETAKNNPMETFMFLVVGCIVFASVKTAMSSR